MDYFYKTPTGQGITQKETISTVAPIERRPTTRIYIHTDWVGSGRVLSLIIQRSL